MINLLLFSMTFVFSISLCRFTYVTGGITNCVNEFDFTQAQSTVIVPLDRQSAPYFDDRLFIETVSNYFEKNLKQYLTPSDEYYLGYCFEGDIGFLEGITEERTPYVASFSLKVRYLGFATFYQEKTFAIVKGNAYES